jgi:hypothetical protein
MVAASLSTGAWHSVMSFLACRESEGGGMPMTVFRTVVLATAGMLLAACWGKEHPDPARYEYLYIGGTFQPPYKAFPTGADRTGWKCYDEQVAREFDCTFVHRGWHQYDYIYRPRR